MYRWLIVLGMIAVGVLVFRLLKRQGGGQFLSQDDENRSQEQ